MLESARKENTKTKRYIVEGGVSKCPVHPPRRDKNRVSIKRTGVDRAARQGIQRIVLIEVQAGVLNQHPANFLQQGEVFGARDVVKHTSGKGDVEDL
jgi:hypothetical protein